ncbi:hereditary hemochromatosis protein homolog [Salminus brasiliensis]|uniref:hereditary hemochromatosis protein homolog n=1 Tax=Salminus brasiliensis TaxID=930266 RepID=UPI003B833903
MDSDCNSAEKHTLQYLYTLRSAPEDGPKFEITTVFNGLIISHCKSPRLVDESRQDWIQQAFTTEEWKSRDLFCESEYYSHRTLKKKIEDVINTTKSIIQRERSCTADDSVVHMSDRWGVNGEDFFTLDPNTLKWSSDSALARSIQSDWNQMKFMTPSLKDFELNQCEPSLMKLKKKKAEYLKQNPFPEVYIFGKPSHDGDTVSLRCYVSHKYLPGVRVHLTLDGVVVDKVNISSPVPNMDGSVQIRLETETSIKKPDRYHCVVDTDNLHITTGWVKYGL